MRQQLHQAPTVRPLGRSSLDVRPQNASAFCERVIHFPAMADTSWTITCATVQWRRLYLKATSALTLASCSPMHMFCRSTEMSLPMAFLLYMPHLGAVSLPSIVLCFTRVPPAQGKRCVVIRGTQSAFDFA